MSLARSDIGAMYLEGKKRERKKKAEKSKNRLTRYMTNDTNGFDNDTKTESRNEVPESQPGNVGEVQTDSPTPPCDAGAGGGDSQQEQRLMTTPQELESLADANARLTRQIRITKSAHKLATQIAADTGANVGRVASHAIKKQFGSKEAK